MLWKPKMLNTCKLGKGSAIIVCLNGKFLLQFFIFLHCAYLSIEL